MWFSGVTLLLRMEGDVRDSLYPEVILDMDRGIRS
jgi:hypothetical protein